MHPILHGRCDPIYHHEREYGCGAPWIARELAARLGWELWNEQLTQEIARLANCQQSDVRKREEHRDPLYYRLIKSFALGSYEGSLDESSVEMLDADSIVRFYERVVPGLQWRDALLNFAQSAVFDEDDRPAFSPCSLIPASASVPTAESSPGSAPAPAP